MDTKVKVIGVGNILCGDDGLGVQAIELLKRERVGEKVFLIRGETDAWFCMQEASETDFTIIIDAVRGGEAPGTIYMIPLLEIAQRPLIFSGHDTGLLDLINLLSYRGINIKGLIIGMEPEVIEIKMGLSETVSQSLKVLVQEVITILDNMK
jgi:hydrogenase maturation protease